MLDQFNTESEGQKGFKECVNIRFQGNTIEVRVAANRMNQFRDQLKEGSVYNFKTFIVGKTRKKYRANDHPYRTKITEITKMEQAMHAQGGNLIEHSRDGACSVQIPLHK
ncbi:hypothetical protein QYE76_023608 [Lolium multiflorum]|uniref:Replication protein A 70 kDa DNA-binding subunit B/D first OB fold domain-containing protein n=1 Tax=Lolium multiflorum TaxID=4521 RepID=A0AAD8RC30_LOLMU|nr:hypothetical protein QYE76_023608 [Lolium multiflorum]